MLDIIWIIICAALVLLMQAGFTCLETGLVRNKNSINVAIKNLMDLCLSGAVFWLFGFGLMFGDSFLGLLGTDHFIFSGSYTPLQYAFFLFQIMFCGTAITIVSGAVAERMSFFGYGLISIMVASVIYPVTGHWAWGGFLDGETQGWLGRLGFIDFAGSTVVHSVGGWCALAAIIVIGPRIGRFESNEKIPGSSLPLSVLGALILLFGWFGFNGGSTLAASESIPLILLNTFLAAIFGCIAAAIYITLKTKNTEVGACINGLLGGLVAITACCHVVTPIASVLIGAIAGIIVCIGEQLLEKYKVDDVVGAVPVHLFAGIWGTLALPLLSSSENWGTGLNIWQQFQVQLLGVCTIGLYVFTVSFALLKIINYFYPLRVSQEAEIKGLNISEHMASTEIYNLLGAMQQQESQGDFRQAVTVEPFTEAGQIAKQYNNVLARVNTEINSREKALNDFKNSESRKGAILNASLDCIVAINTQGQILEFNIAAEKCFGLSAARVLNRSFIDLFVPGVAQKEFSESLKGLFSINSNIALNHHNEITLLRVHGLEFPAELSITQADLLGKKLKEFTFHIRDITKQLEMQNKMHELAFHDVLTGLFNRNYFKEKLAYEISFANRHRSNCLLMFLDLDHFKDINDTLGHEAGDQLLRHVAASLNKCVRAEDIICRWGGDEFLILFPNLEKHDIASTKAEEIIQILHAPISVNGREVFAQVSIGLAISKYGKVEAQQLIQRADMAMYEAKQQGRNTYCFFLPEMEEKLNQRVYIELELRNALKNEEFILYYQPKVDCQKGCLVGFEALLRWQHPEKGLIPPSVFIPILEQSSLINDVTNFVIQTTCQQLNAWKAEGLTVLSVAVNLSMKDFQLDDCYDRVRDALQKHNIQGHLLELEITETMLAKNTDQCIRLMNRLQKMDIKFSVDDFGTGYSSMSYLKKFPIDTLKIDRAFVRECDVNKEDAAICNAIIALGKSLGLKIIAEGVETQSQLDFLKQTECEVYQGFLFSRPLPVEQISTLLLESTRND